MSDSLDDFFAKKDKKRGKDKSKASALSAGALVRELEEGSKQTDYPIRKDNKINTAIELLGLDSNDADWKDFEEVEKRDYSGLKVKEMSLQDQTDDEQRRLNEQVEQIPESTPWKIKGETSSAIAADLAPSSSSLSTSASGHAASVAKPNQEAHGKSTTPSDANPPVSSSNKVAEKTTAATAAAALASAPATTTTATTTVATATAAATNGAAGEQGSNTATDASKKDGDSKNPSAKVAYVPPGQRNAEVKLLEPTRLTKGQSTRHAANLNMQDEKMFPSLG